jgi:hypothetical protein
VHLTPALIPHSQFHSGSWFISVENPLWYYFKRQKNINHISNPDFMESVDRPLQKLVRFLHSEGVATTPSCSGHFRTIQNYQKVFNALEKDGEKIRHDGLLVKNIETGKNFFYKSKHYHLPWNRETFLEKVVNYQRHGVLGMRLGNRRKIKKNILELNIEGAKFKQKDGIVLIEVYQENLQKNISSWKEITSEIEEIFCSMPTVRRVVEYM